MFFRKQKPAVNDNQQRVSEPTLIGEETTIEGTVSAEGKIHIEGRVRGQVKAELCVIGANGIVEGEVVAAEIIVRGHVAGPMRAHHVHLQSEATVEGDITCETIAIDNGARLSGAVWQKEAEAPHKPAAVAYQPSGKLFSEPLWERPQDDDDRPLRAARPRI